ncbi:family 10 glycosylhydrolase, partial [Salmonella enterica]|uniref:family 10 glycosylhydrolase n=1 Tax=Salmonella enterica TaxID=28901 RepID=UPI003CE9A126
ALSVSLVSYGQVGSATEGLFGVSPKREVRAIWLTTISGLDWPRQKATDAAGIRRQQQELCDILDQLKAARFNTVMLQTRVRSTVIYPS